MTETPRCPICHKAPAHVRILNLKVCKRCREMICAKARKQRDV
jgi:hypothetical protein